MAEQMEKTRTDVSGEIAHELKVEERARFTAIGLILLILALLAAWFSIGNAQAAGRIQSGTVDQIEVMDFGTYTAEKINRLSSASGSPLDDVNNVQLISMTVRYPPEWA